MDTPACQNCANSFMVFPEDLEFYQRIKVPPPTFCPECRLIRRFLFFNERNLFKRRDDAGGKDIFSGIPPDAPHKVYDRDYWWSDAWNPMEYGRDYDFSRPFFEQVRELVRDVPWPGRDVRNLVNSDYCNDAAGLKNCYLCFNIEESQDSAYVNDAGYIRSSFDLTDAGAAELSYESIGVARCYRAFFSFSCDECRAIWFCRDCVSCADCFGCVNLKNKQFHIFNKPYSREEYFEKLKEFRLHTFSDLQEAAKKAKEFFARHPQKYYHGWHNVNVSGELIEASKNTFFSYAAAEAESSKFIQFSVGVRDAYDFSGFGGNAELLYESLIAGSQCSGVKFSYNCWPDVRDIEYSFFCGSSSDLFGCAGLRKKQYCILNKQYTREDYFALREKIIRHMSETPYVSQLPTPNSQLRTITYRYGEFFPPEFSPFAYNDTLAQDFFPLTKEEAVNRGYRWRDFEAVSYAPTVMAGELPDEIGEVADSIVREIIRCATCGRAYGIIAMELAFYKEMGLPLPRSCASCRFLRRMREKNPPRYWHRVCSCGGRQSDNGVYANTAEHFHGSDNHCPEEFDTSYAPDRPEIVYCQRCYNTEAVG